MKTISRLIGLLAICITLNAQAQIINMNPDPSGKPWLSGDALSTPPEAWNDAVEFIPSVASLAAQLPSSVYNDQNIWFPYIFAQGGNASCVHVAELFYTFTYEMNRKLNVVPGDGITDLTNLYHPLYTYNFLNEGDSTTATYPKSGFNIIKENGCPPWDVYDDPVLYIPSKNYKYWMTGYSKYKQGVNNTISDIYRIDISIVSTGLDYLKHWIADHGNNESTGGLAIISINTAGWVPYSLIPSGSPHAGERYISSFGTIGSGHALTIVGYNDDILIQDINGDGEYTNDHDVNNDGIFNILDFEKGAFKVANSWGVDWTYGNQGFSFIPYKILYPGSPGLGNSFAYTCGIFPNEEIPVPEISVKASVDHPERNELSIKVGYAAAANSTDPVADTNYNSFNFQGGLLKMKGVYDGPLELGLNFGYFYENAEFGKVFFRIKESDQLSNSNGTINYFSLIDHRWGEDFELYCSQTNVPILNNKTTTLAIEYHLLPHHDEFIAQNLFLGSNRVSRFTSTVTNGSKLTVGNNVKIDMYNSEIHIKPGTTLQLNSNSKIIARRGQCRIIVDGDLIVLPGVQLIAEGDASFEIFLNNKNATIAIQNATFQQCKVHSQVASLSISTSSFVNCKSFYSYVGDLNFYYNTFTNTSLYLENKSKNQNIEAKVTNCNIINTLPNATGIKLINYSKYFISGNTVQGFCNGIDLFVSGSGPAGNKSIIQNNIYDCSWAGILAYNTSGIIENNTIINNGVGIKLMNNCNIAVLGNPDAQTLSQTQQIRDNESYEVYITQFSFPYLFQYNVIIDEDNIGNPTDPMFLFSNAGIIYPQFPKWYVENNCWGSNFNYDDDLKVTYGTFKLYPIWCPGGTKSMNEDPIEEMYAVALEKIKNGYYSDARNILQYLIQNYPRSIQGQAAMKDLLIIEEYNGMNFAGLKNFFLTNDSIVSDSLLKKLGDYLSNQCDIKLENWSQAINWFENRILNPSCLEDSIFSIIDLGNVYFLMENQGLKSAYSGNLTQFIPETKSNYFENRDYLLSLLPGENMSNKLRNDITNLSTGSLLQNVPNPFTGNTQIWYKVEKKANVTISITDLTGKEIRKIEQGTKDKGTYKADFVNSALTPGTYFYSLIIDGQKSDTKKMVMMR
jgi:hypothetical protein